METPQELFAARDILRSWAQFRDQALRDHKALASDAALEAIASKTPVDMVNAEQLLARYEHTEEAFRQVESFLKNTLQ